MPRPSLPPLAHVLPTMVLLLVAVWPLVTGERTLYLRDAANTHLPAKWSQAEAMRDGRLPVLDPLRDGGQPALGNPNTVPLYPDNLIYLVAPTLWAFNAHFWLHLLLAPWACFWLARVWGLGSRAAWAAGACYAASGFFLSSLNLYNLVAGYALAPALAAAALRLTAPGRRRRRLAALAVLWALVLLAGDPMTAAVALAAALAAMAARAGWRAPLGGAPWLALGLGTLLAAPQLVEFLRILPASFRGHWGYSATAAVEASWHPAALFGWLVPFPFGGPDLAFWGQRLFAGDLPLLFALYPGVVALALALAAGPPRGGDAGAAGRWAWGLVAAGLFLALGGHNPVVRALMALPGAGLLRLPVKLWLLVALGAALLCGRGFERAFGDGQRRPLALALAAVGSALAALWLVLTLAPGAARAALGEVAPAAGDGFIDLQRLRWAGLCLAGLAGVAAGAVLLRLAAGRPRLAGALLVALHVASQLLLLRPLLASDEAAVYTRPPALLERLPPAARLVHAAPDGLFGPVAAAPGTYPDARLLWYQRQTRRQLYPAAGRQWGRRYELTRSPEGLDGFLSRATAQTLPGLDDRSRLRLLAASGVDHLLLTRPLAGEAAAAAELLDGGETAEGLWIYRLIPAVPEALFAGSIHRAPHLNGALSRLLDPRFDPLAEVVLPGSAPPVAPPSVSGPPGRVEQIAAGPESLRLTVEAPGPGALVVHRAHLPIWRAEVDGRPAPIVAANIHRLGIELAAGRHDVRLWVDRRPLWAAGLVAGAAALAVLLLAAPHRRPTGW